MLWEPSDNFTLNFKVDYNYQDLSAYPADPVNSTNDLFEITANADLHALDRFGRAVLKMDYEFGNGTVLRSVTGYQDGQSEYRADLDGTSAGNNIFGDLVRGDHLLAGAQPDLARMPGNSSGSLVRTTRTTRSTSRRVSSTSAFRPASTCSTARIRRRPGRYSARRASSFTDRLELQVGARYSDHKTTNHINVNQYGLPLTQDQSAEFSDTSGKVALNLKSTITTSSTASSPRASARVA